jgi:hypothetical protein
MTAADVLADLLHAGFRLQTRGDNIRVIPAGRLTDALRQTILENKRDLLALLRAGASSVSNEPTPQDGQQEARQPAATESVRPNAVELQLHATPNTATVSPLAVDIRDAKPAGPQPLVAIPEPTLLRVEASAPEPLQAVSYGPPPEACPMCGWPPPGSPYCCRCKVVHNAGPNNLPPGLKMEPDGMIYQVGSPAAPVVQGWHRCEVCNAPYQGIRPPFGTPKLCAKCLPGPDSRLREPKSRRRPKAAG